MPYIPHTPEEEAAMLERIGAQDIDALFRRYSFQYEAAKL